VFFMALLSHLATLFVALSLSGSISVQLSSPNSPATSTGAISGVVIDAVTRRPVPGATVSLNRWLGGASGQRVATDSRGRFVFRNLPAADNYYLEASRFGYSPTRYGWTAPNGPLTVRGLKLVPLKDGEWIDAIEIPLWRLGSISGRVVDERGEPLVGIAVRAFTVARIAGHDQLVAGVIGVTDDRGVYRLPQLEPGRYAVAVLSVASTVPSTLGEIRQVRAVGELETGGVGASSQPFLASPAIDVDSRHRLAVTNFATPPPPAGGQTRTYPAAFHPGSRNARDALWVEIGYGDNRGGVDIPLRPVPAFRVSGRAVGVPGPTPAMLLRLMPAGSERLGFGSEAATTLIESDGTFTFLNVPDGEYTLLAQSSVMDFFKGSSDGRLADAPGYSRTSAGVGSLAGAPGLSFLTRLGDSADVWGRSTIVVGGHDIADATLELRPAVSIRGRFVFAAGTTPPDPARDLCPQAQPANGDPSLGWPRGRTERDGSYRFTITGLLGGVYLFSSNLTIVSVTWQGRDLMDAGFDASAGHDFDDVVVTLTDKRTDVTGRVQTDRASDLSAVIAFPADRARWVNYAFEARRFRTTRAGSDGAYQLTGVPAGDYFVIAVDSSQADAWTDPAFLAAAAPLATRVSLDWDSRIVLNLSVKPVAVR
jgi:hypothetical protein